jgi:tRNA G18 (ribose-2'-O)-methylase SpoU
MNALDMQEPSNHDRLDRSVDHQRDGTANRDHWHWITDGQDPRLNPYRDLRNRNPTIHSGYFITEGKWVTERLLTSGWEVESVLVDARHIDHVASLVKPPTSLLVLDPSMIDDLVGYQFHRGILACGRRRPIPMASTLRPSEANQTIVAVHGVQDPENLGSIVRSAAAFAAVPLVLGPQTADPFSRRTLRVSMGTAFRVPFYHSQDLAADLEQLAATGGFQTVATVLDRDAIPLESFQRRGPLIVLFGNEGDGLPDSIALACTDRITLPMKLQTDSLNVSVAAAVFLYALTRS